VRANVIVFDALMMILFVPFYVGADRALGRRKNQAFLLGSVLFSLAIYTTSVLTGMMNFFWYAQNSYFKHYPLGGYIIWLGLVPLAAVLLFYMVSATSYVVSTTLMKRRKLWARSLFAGGIAVLFYLMVDPVAVTNHWWTWNLKSFYVIDVPLLAWIGVFLAVFAYTFLYDLTIVQKAEPKPLKFIEEHIVRRRLFRNKNALVVLNWNQVLGIYCFRLACTFVAYCAVMAPFVALLWWAANRGQIPAKW